MPQGDKSKYSDKQIREAEHIAEGYRKQGKGEGFSKKVAWATVNKVQQVLLSCSQGCTGQPYFRCRDFELSMKQLSTSTMYVSHVCSHNHSCCLKYVLLQIHGGGAKKGGSGTDKVINKEPSHRGGAIGGKASGSQYMQTYMLMTSLSHTVMTCFVYIHHVEPLHNAAPQLTQRLVQVVDY